MIKWAITGNIASGKSTVENILKQHDFQVFDTDKIAHDILKNSQEVKDVFIKEDVFTDGTIDRQKLGKVVFSQPDKLKILENIIHPGVNDRIKELFEQNKDEKHIFISVPLLFESGFDKIFDKIVFVSAPENIRFERLIKRNNLTKEEAIKRIQAQQDETEKIKKSDIVFYNNSTPENLTEQVEKFISSI